MKRKTYDVIVEREPGWWIVRVPDLDDLTTQARRLGQVERNVRDAIAVLLDVDPGSFDIDVTVVTPEDVAADLERSRQVQEEAVAKQREGAALASRALRRLADAYGLTMRESAEVVGISHQRVAQLVSKKKEVA